MPFPIIPAIVLLAALDWGCGGSSSQHSAPRASQLPDPQTYAAAMDAKERRTLNADGAANRVPELETCRTRGHPNPAAVRSQARD